MDVVNRSRHIAGAGTQAAAWAGDPGLASVPAATLDALAPPGVGFHEDVLLVRALEQLGARFAWSALPRMFTSARIDARARGGFGDTLLAMTAVAP